MRKNKKKKLVLKDKLLSILIIVFVLLTIILILLGLSNRNRMDNDDKLVIELSNYFYTKDLNNCASLFNYSDKKVEYSSVSNETKMCIAYQKANIKEFDSKTIKADKNQNVCTFDNMIFRANEETNECTYSKIPRKEIDDLYKKLYGKEVEGNESFKIDNLNICYLKDEYYYCGLSETFTYTLGSESTIYRVINKAVEKGDMIIIYDYFIKIKDKKCYKNYTTSDDIEKCSAKYSDSKKVNYRFMKKYGTKYKHIYKKDKNNNYYWVGSEPIN